VRGGWRKLHNEELRDLYSSPSIIRIVEWRRMRWPGNVARMRENINAYAILVGKPEGKILLGRSRHRWVIILKWILEIGEEDESGRICGRSNGVLIEVLYGHFSAGPKETMENLIHDSLVTVQIRIQHHPNTHLKRYLLPILFGVRRCSVMCIISHDVIYRQTT
jgi:hypothetical protein